MVSNMVIDTFGSHSGLVHCNQLINSTHNNNWYKVCSWPALLN